MPTSITRSIGIPAGYLIRVSYWDTSVHADTLGGLSGSSSGQTRSVGKRVKGKSAFTTAVKVRFRPRMLPCVHGAPLLGLQIAEGPVLAQDDGGIELRGGDVSATLDEDAADPGLLPLLDRNRDIDPGWIAGDGIELRGPGADGEVSLRLVEVLD